MLKKKPKKLSEFGLIIQRTLKDLDCKQEELAEYLGITRQGLAKIMKNEPKQRTIDSFKFFVAKRRGLKIDIAL